MMIRARVTYCAILASPAEARRLTAYGIRHLSKDEVDALIADLDQRVNAIVRGGGQARNDVATDLRRKRKRAIRRVDDRVERIGTGATTSGRK